MSTTRQSGAKWLAALLTELFRPVTHRSVPAETFAAGLVEHGVPQPMASVLASFEIGTARGELAAVSDTVLKFTGRPPENLRDFLEKRRAAFELAA